MREAAFDVLRLMTAEGTNAALVELMEAAPEVDPVLVRCVLARRSRDFLPAFLQAARSDDETTRLEAFQALEIMASDREAAALVALLSETPPGKEREAADRAVWMSCRQIPDPTERARPLLEAIERADTTAECALLPSLARLGGEPALDAVHKAMHDRSRAVRDAGYRALANWPDASVADELFNIAKTSPEESYRIWSLRAYARVVSLPNARPPRKTFLMLKNAMELATRDEDRRLILSRLGTVRVPEALELLMSFVDREAFREASIPAAYELAKGLSQTHPEEAKAALVRVESLTDDAAMLQQIPKVLRGIDTRLQKQKK